MTALEHTKAPCRHVLSPQRLRLGGEWVLADALDLRKHVPKQPPVHRDDVAVLGSHDTPCDVAGSWPIRLACQLLELLLYGGGPAQKDLRKRERYGTRK